MSNFICPKCGERIQAWQEYSHTKYYPINPETGEQGNVCYKATRNEPVANMEGFCCTKCNWLLNSILAVPTGKDKKLMEALNK